MSTKVSKSKKNNKKKQTNDPIDNADPTYPANLDSLQEISKILPKSPPKSTSREYAAYLIINDDLKMSKGKIAAQSAHAILNVHRFMEANKIINKAWENNGEKIVALKASSDIIQQILAEYGEPIPKHNKLNVFPIFDAGRTEVEAGSLTIIATTPITDNIKPDILNELKLL